MFVLYYVFKKLYIWTIFNDRIYIFWIPARVFSSFHFVFAVTLKFTNIIVRQIKRGSCIHCYWCKSKVDKKKKLKIYKLILCSAVNTKQMFNFLIKTILIFFWFKGWILEALCSIRKWRFYVYIFVVNTETR